MPADKGLQALDFIKLLFALLDERTGSQEPHKTCSQSTVGAQDTNDAVKRLSTKVKRFKLFNSQLQCFSFIVECLTPKYAINAVFRR